MKQRIVLLGPPASGKGTQAEMIQARYRFPVTSPGAILRDERKAGTRLGMEAEAYTSQGQLAPNEIVNALVETWLARQRDAFVFDGYPRSLGQATALDAMLERRGSPLDVVLSLEADAQTIRDRVARRLTCVNCGKVVSIGLQVPTGSAPCPGCGSPLSRRADDTVETLDLRMNEYAEKTEPLVSYFLARGLLCRIDAAPSPEKVFASIVSVLEAA